MDLTDEELKTTSTREINNLKLKFFELKDDHDKMVNQIYIETNDMIRNRMYMNDIAIKNSAERIKEKLFLSCEPKYHITEEGDILIKKTATDEEKEAIEISEELHEVVKKAMEVKYRDNELKALQTIIKKQQKEIEELKEKNKALVYIENQLMPLAECGYWDYEKHTCSHTCRGCDFLNENNRRTDTGILIDKDRYCRLYEDGDCEEDTKFVSVPDLILRHWKGENNE